MKLYDHVSFRLDPERGSWSLPTLWIYILNEAVSTMRPVHTPPPVHIAPLNTPPPPPTHTHTHALTFLKKTFEIHM